MALKDFFTATPTISAIEAKGLLAAKEVGQYNLIDVRQPGEYAEQHLPGAQLIPLGELPNRLAEIDPNKPTIIY